MSVAPSTPGRLPRGSGDALWVVAVALIARLAVVAWARGRFPPVEDGHYYDVFARRLASGAGYTWLWPDGAVTYAAHYPVGYPALLALPYRLLGASAGLAMAVNALLGAASAWGAYRIVDSAQGARWRPLAAGLAVALHPALVAYTPALMTEGVTASLLVLAAAMACCAADSERPWPRVFGAGLAMGVATLVRPQSLLLAPVFGAIAAGERTSEVHSPSRMTLRSRVARAGVVTAVALGCVAPWTARNCVRMHHCALVSVNGGWNLLIGAQTASGGWEPLAVPAACAQVWDEAAKDVCFERAARRAIAAAPGEWLARIPAKLGMTFDYFGAAPWYLHASNAAMFDDKAKAGLGSFETVACRLLLLGALVSCGRMQGGWPRLRKLVALAGAIGAVSLHGWLGYVALVGCAALLGRSLGGRHAAAVLVSAAAIASTAVVHAVFFGAGRYGLVVAPFVAAMAFAGAARRPVAAVAPVL